MDDWMRDILLPNVDGVPNSTSNFPDELFAQPPVLTMTIGAPLLTNDGYFGDGDYSQADQFFPNFEYPASVDDDLVVILNPFPLTNARPDAPPEIYSNFAPETPGLNDTRANNMALEPSNEGGFVAARISPNLIQNLGSYNSIHSHEYGSALGALEDSLVDTSAITTTSPPAYLPTVDTSVPALGDVPAHPETVSDVHGHSSFIAPADSGDNDLNATPPDSEIPEWMDVPLVLRPSEQAIRFFYHMFQQGLGGHIKKVVCSLCALEDGIFNAHDSRPSNIAFIVIGFHLSFFATILTAEQFTDVPFARA
ncbi:hypothetical protein FRC11_005387, partial [Ceratobasidium sp. 423]